MIESINCLDHCNGACCGGDLYWRLSQEEAAFLTVYGTHLVLTNNIPNKLEELEYHRMGRCGLLRNGRCLAYNKPLFPKVCVDFPVGDYGCLKLRFLNPEFVRVLTTRDNKFQKWYLESSKDQGHSV